jgi:hypothetical protein
MFLCLWGICVIAIWFRPSIEIFWKILATIILAFYLWFFNEELINGYSSFQKDWYVLFVDFLKELITMTFTTLFFLWPVALIIIFYKADDTGAEKLLKFMCILTLVLWIVLILLVFYDKGIDKFLYENLKKMIPNAK